MALDSLKLGYSSKFTHLPKHDLESLFYVLLTICTYTTGPGCLRSPIPNITEPSICLNEWWDTCDRHRLAREKGVLLDSFEYYILDHLPSYWEDFHPVLCGLRAAIWPKKDPVLTQPNVATHDGFMEVLTKAMEQYRIAEEEVYPFAPVPPKSKRTRRSADNGQDVDEAEAMRANKVT